ncbi:MAG: thioredoxin domain-containing protein [Anaerolineales bacterium]|nr:thioredoxin domain-containing protein [Anaerolineales bacterium]
MSKRQFIEERRKNNQRQRTLMLTLMIGGLVIVAAAITVAFISSSRVNLSQKDIIQPDIDLPILADRNTLGDPNAPVVIEEYSDFGCSHCADFALGTKMIIEQEYIESGQVYLVFHSVGGLLGSPATLQAAEGAYCAGDQDAFWPFHDLIFANQVTLFQNRTADISGTLVQFAEILDLNPDQFETCLTERKYKELAAQDEVDAAQKGINGTPTFIINGVELIGNQPFEIFQQVIEEELVKAGE